MMNNEFEKMKTHQRGLLSFNNFLSASIDEQVLFTFASSARDDPDLTEILFQIEIDPSNSSVPYATLDDISFYSDSEKEVLFSMHIIFRIGDIKSIENRLWKVHLTLTSDTDQQLMNLAKFIRDEIGEAAGWVRMAGLMIKMGKFDKAVEIYNTLLETIANDDRENFAISLPSIISNTAAAHASLGNYSISLEYLKAILGTMEELLSSNHPLLAKTYNNIGTLYRLTHEYSTALSYYEKPIEIIQNVSPIDETELAISHCNMGGVYESLGNYPSALSYYEKALEIDQKYLPTIHSDLAHRYFDIGRLHESMGNYTIALSFFEKALATEKKSLPQYHPDLASTYRIIAGIYQSMGEYSTALSYYEKTIDIEEHALPSNRPDRGITFNGIDEVYQALGNYSTALSYYKKSLEIKQTSLSSDHVSLAATYNNIGLTHQSTEDYSTALLYCTGWPISNRTKYFPNFFLIHYGLGLIFILHILDDISHRCSI
jgi:tetratricopeptide (TPR) repeat protein